MPKRRLNIRNASGAEGPLVIINETVTWRDSLVYFVVADRPVRYANGKNRIVYIGQTGNGAERIFISAVEYVHSALRLHGVSRLSVYAVHCAGRQRVRTWKLLERACLIAFRELYGQIPKLNTQGKGFEEDDEFDYFSRGSVGGAIRRWER